MFLVNINLNYCEVLGPAGNFLILWVKFSPDGQSLQRSMRSLKKESRERASVTEEEPLDSCTSRPQTMQRPIHRGLRHHNEGTALKVENKDKINEENRRRILHLRLRVVRKKELSERPRLKTDRFI